MMRAIVVDASGRNGRLELRENRPVPRPSTGEVLVRVAAAGVNFADVLMRREATADSSVFVPGVEGVGVIEAVGGGVTGFASGDRVAWAPVTGAASVGSYAEFATVGTAQLLRVPDDVPLGVAAAVTLQGLTAGYLVNDIARVAPDRTVLVHAAAGGTGRMVVQWAAHLGARVIGAVSTDEKAEIAIAAGASAVVVVSHDPFVETVLALTEGQGADYIVNGVGGSTFRDDLDCVAVRGHIVAFGRSAGVPDSFSPLDLVARSISVTGGYMTNFLRTEVEIGSASDRLWRGVQEGWLDPLVESLPLDEAAAAHERLETRASVGKLVLEVDGGLR